MEKMKLEFSRDWRNPADFPTVETDETQVRADMQALYTEIQTFLNETLIPAMEALETPSIDHLPIEQRVSDSEFKIPTSRAVSKLFASSGNLPTGGQDGQFLVKEGEDYGQARWASFAIPKWLSDLTATDENGMPVNAQQLMTDVADKARSRFAEVIASGSVGFGTAAAAESAVVSLGDVSAYDRIFVEVVADTGGNADRIGAIYLGRWNGAYIESVQSDGDTRYDVSTEGMVKLSSLPTYGSEDIDSDLAVYPFFGKEDSALAMFGTQGEHLKVFEVTGIDYNAITIFARDHYLLNTADGTRTNPYKVWGIRRGAKEAE